MAVVREAVFSAKQIEADLGLDHLVSRIMELPQEIRMQQEAVAAAKQAVDLAKGEVELAEAVLVAEISEARDPKTNKAMFTNETARRAELLKRKTTDEQYKEAAKTLAEAEDVHRSAQFDLDRLVHEFSAARNVAQLQARRLDLIAGRAS